jgi:trehalose utilization protein
MAPIHVTVWNEYVNEKEYVHIGQIYPKGIHMAIAEGILKHESFKVRTATLDQPEHGLTNEILDRTHVLIWWSHMVHEQVEDEIVDRIYQRVMDGMGLIVLHSGAHSKLFKKLMGTSCRSIGREADDAEKIWVVNPTHPIADGIGPYIELAEEEMYGEYFDIPTPDELIFISWYTGGEVLRSGITFHRGKGKIFYFAPGHEEHPTYHHPEICKVIANGVKWASSPYED